MKKRQIEPSTDSRMPLQAPRKPAGAFLEVPRYPTSGDRVKLTSEALMALQRHLPFYEENRPSYEVKKLKGDIRWHKKMLKEAEDDLSRN